MIRRSRINRALLNRDAKRKYDKKQKRARAIRWKVIHLLNTCSVEILRTGILSQEDFDELCAIYHRVIASQVGDIDYWPIPKVINNNIRRYVHNHREKVKTSLWDKIIIRAIEEGAANISLEARPTSFCTYTSASTLHAIQTSLYEAMLNQTGIPSSFL